MGVRYCFQHVVTERRLPRCPDIIRINSGSTITVTGFGHGNGIFNNWFRFDIAEETWTEVASLPAEARVAGTQFAYDGIGYVLSGDGEDHRSMETGEFWAYDPISDTWDERPPHPEGHAGRPHPHH